MASFFGEIRGRESNLPAPDFSEKRTDPEKALSAVSYLFWKNLSSQKKQTLYDMYS